MLVANAGAVARVSQLPPIVSRGADRMHDHVRFARLHYAADIMDAVVARDMSAFGRTNARH